MASPPLKFMLLSLSMAATIFAQSPCSTGAGYCSKKPRLPKWNATWNTKASTVFMPW